ncbi:tRNA (adenosine(37)-N6)-dimethylallyltransferase MiaA [Ignatzschineria cameli]|uniref:tRNA dimethylallyltransferase n=1 Tax=Ignatzschineria cameli TaxID=2182793 RepID=A0A2U2AR28_9GAMM|nr:tRNA (adenosine(37)-N6)-dimethylallyltransferase MiaA [Ignatzschineria cameli]PWD85224.1 tRNA (adenosine(37)-N6)-dimethylallyltransferase MiaA [Ignatzschineria cameli]PWD86350.1 tRNA (adenosine(37)-N6)-dimethylallyltransferase MiaA [Ignatzschineria cameli]PWD89812.1 tRNA (adenosine(37)-N6)-dimethylallyltransferase MiaA [Ignatzschineria cameli]PWD91462.1 tRNA (adenosine(37)-N6)-dimethylallyltransferase MiaA [Ignatzschineria cameli]PWD92500.1 tRNA (adenosine(37)-N6)-dimethylallyltransferase M
MNKRVICLMGPTATGKTELAMRIADQIPVEIISVDSAMIYREMNIGTAKPDAETLIRYPHRLIDICEPTERYSTAEFRRDAIYEIERSFAAGKIPLLVGGTFLYFQSLLEGISPIPQVSSDTLKQLTERAEIEGSAVLHQALKEVDPDSFQRLNPNDTQRVIRALSVYLETGKPLTYYWNLPKKPGIAYPFLKIALANSDEKRRNQQIAQRYHKMIDAGLIEEVATLREHYPELNLDYPSMRAVGYRQIWNYLEGEMTLSEAVERAIIATRQYAKRQRTWLRSEENLSTFEVNTPHYAEEALHQIQQFIES